MKEAALFLGVLGAFVGFRRRAQAAVAIWTAVEPTATSG